MTRKNKFVQSRSELLPREKMMAAAEPASVDDKSLLAVLLKTGSQGCDVLELAGRLIDAFGSLRGLVNSDWRGIEARISEYNDSHPENRIKGIGRVKCLELSAAFELGRRGSRLSHQDLTTKCIFNAADAYCLFREIVVAAESQESLFVLPLDAKHRPLCEPFRVSLGTSDYTPVVSRDVFRKAVSWGARSLIVAHNHPSGDPTPSKNDIEVTRKLQEAARVLDVRVLDHLILGSPVSGRAGYVSVVEFMKERENV